VIDRTKTVIFTDLDASLLDAKTYSFKEAMPALKLIREKGIPLVLCSSKTRVELELYRKRLQNKDPFVAENGGAVFVPAGYFTFLTGSVPREEYVISAFGTSYEELRKALAFLRESMHIPVRGFGDMTVEEIAALTGLPQEEAALARARDFSEPFVFEQGVNERFLKAIENRGFHWTQGKLYCLMGDHDKGRAVRLLKRWYESERGTLITIGLGDGLNDLALLKEMDRPVLIQKEDGSYDPRIELPHLIKARGIGPAGWNRALLELLKS
jgi:mannosyl-3-phosphoglycerate phosphatase family protein